MVCHFDLLLIIFLIGIFIGNVANSIISPFFPTYAQTKLGINQDIVGIMFSAHPVGVFIASMMLSQLQKKQITKKQCLFLGACVQLLGQGMFIVLEFVNEKISFIILGLLARFIIGTGYALFSTTAFAIIPLLYKNEIEQKIGLFEAFSGLGLSIGPFLGGTLFIYGYYVPFLTVSSFLVVLIPFLYFLIPANPLVKKSITKQSQSNKQIILDDNENEGLNQALIQNISSVVGGDSSKQFGADSNISQASDQDAYQQQLKSNVYKVDIKEEGEQSEVDDHVPIHTVDIQIKYSDIFSDRSILLTYIIIMIPACGFLFLDPTYAPFLQGPPYYLDTFQSGIILALNSVFYLIGCPFGSFFVKKLKNNRILLFIGNFTIGVCFIFLGPDNTLLPFIPQKLWIACIANAVMGIGAIFSFIPAMPELLILLQCKFPEEKEEIIGDISSALYNSSYAIGNFIGPILGGFLCQNITFTTSTAIFGFSIIGYSIIYIIFGGAPRNKKNLYLQFSKHQEHLVKSVSNGYRSRSFVKSALTNPSKYINTPSFLQRPTIFRTPDLKSIGNNQGKAKLKYVIASKK